MAKLNATYTNTGRSIYTELNGDGSSLLGAVEGLASRAALATSVLQHVSVTPSLIDITLKDGSKLYASGHFNSSFEASSFSDFIGHLSGTINQISEIETASPSAPRYTLSGISLDAQDYFSTASWNDVLKGGDSLTGGIGPDDLIDYGGRSTFNGMGGNDHLAAVNNDQNLAVYRGTSSQYQIGIVKGISFNGMSGLDGHSVTDKVVERDGTDILVNIDRLQFSDTNVALDYQAGGHAGQAYRLYKGVLGREGEPAGLGFVINWLDQGETLPNVASGFLHSPEFQAKYGNTSQADFINLLYHNILGRAGDAGGIQYINNWMAHGATREEVVLGFTESPEYIAQCITLIGNNGIHYTPLVTA